MPVAGFLLRGWGVRIPPGAPIFSAAYVSWMQVIRLCGGVCHHFATIGFRHTRGEPVAHAAPLAWQHVAVHVQRDGGGGVAELFGYRAQVLTTR
jgi:hypothetical protein